MLNILFHSWLYVVISLFLPVGSLMRVQVIHVTGLAILKPKNDPEVSADIDGIVSIKRRFFQFMQPEGRSIQVLQVYSVVEYRENHLDSFQSFRWQFAGSTIFKELLEPLVFE